jgi:F0F1-type ATP synthase assembly protein I
MQKSTTANDTRNYVTLTIAIIIGMVGVYFRFLGDSFFYTSVSNVILIIGIIIALRVVFSILK